MTRIGGALAVAVTAVACSGVPTETNSRDSSVADARRATWDAAIADASTADASPDDASTTDAGPPSLNPFGITLTDVTDGMVTTYLGGRVDGNGWGLGSGAAVGDVDGDGDLDIVLARCDSIAPAPPGGPTLLLEQRPAIGGVPTFASDSELASVFAGECAYGAALGDYDGDGDLDLFVAMAGVDRLLQNDGTGGFTDVTASANVGGPSDDLSSGAAWADVNADGLLDLFVLSHTPLVSPNTSPRNANRLYINQADGSFVEVGAAAGISGDGSSQAVAIANLDADSDLEIYVANDTFAIEGAGGIADLQPDAWLDPTGFDAAGVPSYADRATLFETDGRRSAMGIALADLDRDSRVEIYVSDWGPNHLQQWDSASGTYVDVAANWNLALPTAFAGYRRVSWGAQFLDLDRDGSEELFLVNGSITEPINCHSLAQLDLLLRRPPRAARFDDITTDVGLPAPVGCTSADLSAPYSGRGVVVADLDSDGDDDLIVSPFAEKYRFYRNDTLVPAHHAVRVQLRGTVSAPDPIGATLIVTDTTGETRTKTLYAGGTPNGQSHRVLEVGLGGATSVLSAWVQWPSGYRQRIDQRPTFALDTTLAVSEPAWLELSTRTAAGAEPAPRLDYVVVGDGGTPAGAAGAGRNVSLVRSDGIAATVVDNGDGTYTASLPHPGTPRITVVTLTVDGEPQAIRPRINYR